MYMIDVNYFPSYSQVQNIRKHLADFILQMCYENCTNFINESK